MKPEILEPLCKVEELLEVGPDGVGGEVQPKAPTGILNMYLYMYINGYKANNS